MKVVQITTAACSLRFLPGHIRFQQQQGVEVHTISSYADDLADFAAQHDCTSHAIEMQRRIAPLSDLKSLWQLTRLLRKIRPQLVHAHTPKAGLLGMLAATLARVPVKVYHIHGLPLMTAQGTKRRLLKLCDQLACRFAHKIYCVSDSLRQVVADEGITSANQMEVLGHGSISGIDASENYNPERFSPDAVQAIRRELGIHHDAKVVGFVGRLVRDKGVHELLDAWQQLRQLDDTTRLLMIGPSESADAISEQARSMLATDPRIHHVEWTDNPAKYYATMDVLAFPTYREGFGLVATEAAAMKVPVVATRIPGCVDAVEDGVTGTLVPAQDAQALADELQRYLADPELRSRHGIAGRRRVLRDFVPSVIHESLWNDYLLLAADKKCIDVERYVKREDQLSKAA